jgi:hypothetical protein
VHSHALWSHTKENHENLPKIRKRGQQEKNPLQKIATEISEQNDFTNMDWKFEKSAEIFKKSLFRAIV